MGWGELLASRVLVSPDCSSIGAVKAIVVGVEQLSVTVLLFVSSEARLVASLPLSLVGQTGPESAGLIV
jgi:hypothetical protein